MDVAQNGWSSNRRAPPEFSMRMRGHSLDLESFRVTDSKVPVARAPYQIISTAVALPCGVSQSRNGYCVLAASWKDASWGQDVL